jgi:hypothetical protein
MNYFLKVLCQTDSQPDQAAVLTNERALKKVQSMYDGQGHGAELASASGTAWGLLNAVTEFVDRLPFGTRPTAIRSGAAAEGTKPPAAGGFVLAAIRPITLRQNAGIC